MNVKRSTFPKDVVCPVLEDSVADVDSLEAVTTKVLPGIFDEVRIRFECEHVLRADQ